MALDPQGIRQPRDHRHDHRRAAVRLLGRSAGCTAFADQLFGGAEYPGADARDRLLPRAGTAQAGVQGQGRMARDGDPLARAAGADARSPVSLEDRRRALYDV